MASSVLPAADRIQCYTRELVAYVRSLFPMRFYGGESWWTVYAAAALLRLADMADAVLAHLPARRDLDAAAAIRAMYELAITLSWILIEPESRLKLWEGEALWPARIQGLHAPGHLLSCRGLYNAISVRSTIARAQPDRSDEGRSVQSSAGTTT